MDLRLGFLLLLLLGFLLLLLRLLLLLLLLLTTVVVALTLIVALVSTTSHLPATSTQSLSASLVPTAVVRTLILSLVLVISLDGLLVSAVLASGGASLATLGSTATLLLDALRPLIHLLYNE